MRIKYVTALAIVLVMLGVQLPTFGAETVSNPSKIEELTRRILLTQIELERFNIHYSMEVAKQGRWKGWRYGAFQEANAALGLSGALVATVERAEHIHSPLTLHPAVMEISAFVPMIGSILGASAAALEFSINELHEAQANHHGFSAKAARLHVEELKQRINNYLEERSALIAIEGAAPELAERSRMDQVEGRVLSDLRDQSLQEFERFHIGARKLVAFQQTQYVLDAFKNAVLATGFEMGYLVFHRHQDRYNGRAGVFFIIGSSIFMSAPIVSRLTANAVARFHRHYLKPTTQSAENSTLSILQNDRDALSELVKNRAKPDSADVSVARFAVYGVEQKAFEDSVASGRVAKNKSVLSATQNIAPGLYIGGSGVAGGTLGTIVGFNRNFNNGTTLRSDRTTNNDLFAATVVSLPAYSYVLIENLRINVQGEITRHKLQRSGKLPHQLLVARLQQLEDLQEKIKPQN